MGYYGAEQICNNFREKREWNGKAVGHDPGDVGEIVIQPVETVDKGKDEPLAPDPLFAVCAEVP